MKIKKNKSKTDPFKNKSKQDLPVDETRIRLQKILNSKVSKEFLEWYRQDYQPGGFTTPGLKYQGPGNPTNIGKPVNDADALAEKHDLQYAFASYKYSKGKITEDEFKRRITKIDEEFLKNNAVNVTSSFNPLEQVSSLVGTVGIGLKYGAESIIGQQYPSTEQNKTFTGVPKQQGKLADKLLGNLKGNVNKSMDQHMSTPQKRPHENEVDSTGSPAKIAASGSQFQGQAQTAMNLPGTGAPQAGGSPKEGVFEYTAPSSTFGRKVSTYRKDHKIQTFGITSDGVLQTAIANINAIALPTCLAEVPWELPVMYLSPNEFALIPNGSHVTKMKMQIRYRKTTVQFETNSSSTQEAVLNQLTDVVCAEGLNKSGWGSNVWPTAFIATNPMKCTGVNLPVYAGSTTPAFRGLQAEIYGEENASTNFLNYVPHYQLGLNWVPRNYFAMTTQQRVNTPLFTQAIGGWPALWSKVKQYDGDTINNEVIIDVEYVPKMGLLKPPIRYKSIGLPIQSNAATSNVLTVPTVGSKGAFWTPNITRTASEAVAGNQYVNSTITDTTNNPNQISGLQFTLLTPVEKSQYMRTGGWGDANSHTQPSVHVGVQPIPALSTGALTAEDNTTIYTTTKGYFYVTCEMEVVEYLPTAYPHIFANEGTPDIPFGDQIYWADVNLRPANHCSDATTSLVGPRQAGALKGGLYTTQVTSIV